MLGAIKSIFSPAKQKPSGRSFDDSDTGQPLYDAPRLKIDVFLHLVLVDVKDPSCVRAALLQHAESFSSDPLGSGVSSLSDNRQEHVKAIAFARELADQLAGEFSTPAFPPAVGRAAPSNAAARWRSMDCAYVSNLLLDVPVGKLGGDAGDDESMQRCLESGTWLPRVIKRRVLPEHFSLISHDFCECVDVEGARSIPTNKPQPPPSSSCDSPLSPDSGLGSAPSSPPSRRHVSFVEWFTSLQWWKGLMSSLEFDAAVSASGGATRGGGASPAVPSPVTPPKSARYGASPAPESPSSFGSKPDATLTVRRHCVLLLPTSVLTNGFLDELWSAACIAQPVSSSTPMSSLGPGKLLPTTSLTLWPMTCTVLRVSPETRTLISAARRGATGGGGPAASSTHFMNSSSQPPAFFEASSSGNRTTVDDGAGTTASSRNFPTSSPTNPASGMSISGHSATGGGAGMMSLPRNDTSALTFGSVTTAPAALIAQAASPPEGGASASPVGLHQHAAGSLAAVPWGLGVAPMDLHGPIITPESVAAANSGDSHPNGGSGGAAPSSTGGDSSVERRGGQPPLSSTVGGVPRAPMPRPSDPYRSSGADNSDHASHSTAADDGAFLHSASLLQLVSGEAYHTPQPAPDFAADDDNYVSPDSPLSLSPPTDLDTFLNSPLHFQRITWTPRHHSASTFGLVRQRAIRSFALWHMYHPAAAATSGASSSSHVVDMSMTLGTTSSAQIGGSPARANPIDTLLGLAGGGRGRSGPSSPAPQALPPPPVESERNAAFWVYVHQTSHSCNFLPLTDLSTSAVSLLSTILKNLDSYREKDHVRSLNAGSERFYNELGRFGLAMELLRRCGFKTQSPQSRTVEVSVDDVVGSAATRQRLQAALTAELAAREALGEPIKS